MSGSRQAYEEGRKATPQQRRFYMLEELAGPKTYRLREQISVDSRLEPERLVNAIQSVIEDQPAMRTLLFEREGELRQRTVSTACIPVHVVQVEEFSAEEATSALLALEETISEGLPCVLVVVRPFATEVLLSIHHAHFDEQSADLWMSQVARRYANPSSHIGARDIKPRDTSSDLDDMTWWRAELSRLSQPTTLPQATRGSRSGKCEALSVLVPIEVADQLRAVTRSLGVTPFSMICSAVCLLTSRYRDELTAAVEVVVAGRNDEEREKIGCYQSTLPLILSPGSAGTARELLDSGFDALTALLEHRRIQYEDLLDGYPSALRQFSTVLVLAAQQVQEIAVDELVWSIKDLGRAVTSHDLELSLRDDGEDGWHISLVYRTAALSRRQAERIAQDVLAVLRILPDLEGDLQSLDLFRQYQLPSTPRPRSVAEVLTSRLTAEVYLAAGPARDNAFVDGPDGRMSQAQLCVRAGTLAQKLKERGVEVGDRVGIFVDRGAQLLVAMIAAWWAGCVIVPLDRSYPKERLQYMIKDAGVRVVVGAQATHLDAVITVDLDGSAPAAARDPECLSASDEAVVFYTSGSSGQPKGVAVTHGNLLTTFESFTATLGETAAGMIAGSSTGFDVSLLELIWPLKSATPVYVRDHRTILMSEQPKGLAYQCVPTFARMLVQTAAGRAFLTSLGVLYVGGEALAFDLAQELFALLPGRVWNLYGPTETTIWSMAWKVKPGTPVLLGAALPSERVYVLDGVGRVVAPDCVGRLYVAGEGVTAGYFRMPELTEERFEETYRTGEDRLYDTGDVVERVGDEDLRYLSRADSQIKLLGQRIEIEEIEAVLRSFDGIQDAAVGLARRDAPMLVAFCTPSGGSEAPALQIELQEYARQKLTPTMIPRIYHFVDDFPRTANAKLNRTALQQLADDAVTRSVEWPTHGEPGVAGDVEDESEVLHLVISAWCRALGKSEASLDQTFFEAGGSSRQLMHLAALLRPVYPNLTLGQLFAAPSPRLLARDLQLSLVASGGMRTKGLEADE